MNIWNLIRKVLISIVKLNLFIGFISNLNKLIAINRRKIKNQKKNSASKYIYDNFCKIKNKIKFHRKYPYQLKILQNGILLTDLDQKNFRK